MRKMKAALLYKLGETPVYSEIPEPKTVNGNQLLMTVKAASVKNLDKLRASGKHYASYTEFPAIMGIDGVGILEDGTKVYAQGVNGMLAEKAIINKNAYTVIPKNLDFITAAALPNAVLGATMAIKSRAKIQKGHVVLINGATGVTGQIAVQVARYYGASKIIVTGRNQELLNELKALGADIIISLHQADESIIEQLKKINQEIPIDIVIDYIWGNPIELIIKSLKGGGLHTNNHTCKIVTVGSMAGETISLTSSSLRSTAIEILGSGLGSLSQQDMDDFTREVLPEMFELAAQGKLKIKTETEDLANIESVWNRKSTNGSRLVIKIS